MSAFFSSPEFAETQLTSSPGQPGSGHKGSRRLRMDVFHDEGFYELYLVDREYLSGKAPRDVQVTSQGVFTSFMEALTAIDDFIQSYNKQQFDDQIERLRGAFDVLTLDPAAQTIDVPSDLLSRGLMRFAAAP